MSNVTHALTSNEEFGKIWRSKLFLTFALDIHSLYKLTIPIKHIPGQAVGKVMLSECSGYLTVSMV